jgi:radical SAM superfamily enzyme YgiQ (UPF0313 family)
MTARVLLINPSRTYGWGAKGVRLGLPLGLMYVAAVLERAGMAVRIFDCLLCEETRISEAAGIIHHGVDDDVFRRRLREEAPDIVGVGAPFTAQAANALHAMTLVRDAAPAAVIVAGGPHFTVTGKDFMAASGLADYVIAGEGEHALPDLIRALADGGDLRAVPNLIWRDPQGRVVANPVVPIKDLDELPLPAYHLVDMGLYFRRIDEGIATRVRRARSISMITSRGCPYTCTFCSINLHMGSNWRAHSPEYTLNHIEHVLTTYDVRHISFEDDNFTFKRSRCLTIVAGLTERGLKLTWDTPNGIRADTLNDELLDAMKASGCVGLIIAAESGDQTVLDTLVKKKIKLEHLVHAAKLCFEHELPLSCFFIIGFPGETREQIQRTLDFAFMLYSKYDVMPQMMVATPLYGTELYDVVVEQKLLVADITPERLAVATQLNGQGLIRTDQFDPEYLRDAHSRLMSRIRRHRLARMLGDVRQYPRLAAAVWRRLSGRKQRRAVAPHQGDHF